MNRLNLTVAVIVACVGLDGLVLPTAAAAAELEEVVVTARQRSELLQDVPSSITAFTESDIKRAGIKRAEDFINLTPGVSMVDTAEVGDTQVSIRGINGARDGEANFAFIVDGVLLTNPSAFNREYSDLQQIEVLKGPQGALYGRSASAGAIIITTKKPGNEFEMDFTASGAKHESGFAAGSVSGALIQDKLFGRMSFDYRRTDGFYYNSFLNKDSVDDFEGFNINNRLLWEPNERTSVDTRFRYGEVDAASISFNAAFALAGLEAVVVRGTRFLENANEHDFTFNSNIDPSNDQQATEFSIKIDHDMDWATATGWFLYSNIEQSLSADGTSGAFYIFGADPGTGRTIGGLMPEPTCRKTAADNANPNNLPYGPNTCDGTQFQIRDQRDFSVDFRLTSPGENRLRWQAGAYYLHLEREVGVNLAIDDGNPIVERLFHAGVENLLHDEFTTDVYAIYGNIAYDITPDIEAAFALRYDLEDRNVENRVPADATTRYVGGGGISLNPGITTLGVAIPERKDSWDQLQPKLSLTWDATDNVTLFSSYGIGFKSGGFNNSGAAATVARHYAASVTISDTFEKEVSSAVEVGFKSEFGRVKLDGAVYHTQVDDMQFFEFFVGEFGLLRVVNTIDEVAITGAELATSIDLGQGLSVFAGYGLVNGQIEANASRPYTIGNEVPYAPKYTANLGANLDTQLHNDINLTARIDWNIVGETWFHTVQDELTVANVFTPNFGANTDLRQHVRERYNIINLRAGLSGKHWSVTGFVNNVTDTRYLEEVIPAPEFGGSFIHPGNRRLIGVEVGIQF